MSRSFCVLLLCCFLNPYPLLAQKIKIASPLKFLALGDSYTVGEGVALNGPWPNQLADSLRARGVETERLSIVAKTGWRTDQLIEALKAETMVRNYTLVSLLIGVNNQYQGRPLDQYKTEFAHLLTLAAEYAGGDYSRVIVISIPDYAYTPFGKGSNKNNISEEIDNYNAIAKSQCKFHNVLFIDITDISRKSPNIPSLVAEDELHPSAYQYSMWVHRLINHMEIPKL